MQETRAFEHVRKNEYGFYELEKKPTADELNAFYSNQYFQAHRKVPSYSDAEKQFLYQHAERKWRQVLKRRPNWAEQGKRIQVLDVGCGEGWNVQRFHEAGCEIKGLDYSSYALNAVHPNLMECFVEGDLSRFSAKPKSFDCIILDNVIEHVLEPKWVLERCRELLQDDGILIVEVPNDCSAFQQFLIQNDLIERSFWIAIPDHINYFNPDGLDSLAKSCMFHRIGLQSDFPIDWNLANEKANYVNDKSNGKAAHHQRLNIEAYFGMCDPNDVDGFYEALAKLNLGRNFTFYYEKE